MVSALSYTQQKEKCVYYGACVGIYTKKEVYVYSGACVVIYTTKGEVCVLWCMCCHIHNKKISVCSMVHVLSYTQQK